MCLAVEVQLEKDKLKFFLRQWYTVVSRGVAWEGHGRSCNEEAAWLGVSHSPLTSAFRNRTMVPLAYLAHTQTFIHIDEICISSVIWLLWWPIKGTLSFYVTFVRCPQYSSLVLLRSLPYQGIDSHVHILESSNKKGNWLQ